MNNENRELLELAAKAAGLVNPKYRAPKNSFSHIGNNK